MNKNKLKAAERKLDTFAPVLPWLHFREDEDGRLRFLEHVWDTGAPLTEEQLAALPPHNKIIVSYVKDWKPNRGGTHVQLQWPEGG